jgi:2-C-methyl-D-erythritol 4-phosphate cytidylyltransferase
VLVAAGRGERRGGDRPKAFAYLGGRPLLAESLERLERCDAIDAIVVVAPPGWEEPVILLAEELSAAKVAACVPGGSTRSQSVRIGLAEVADDANVVLVHDAARPLLPQELVERLLEAIAGGYDGAVPGLAVTDTIKRTAGEIVTETLPRSELVAVQTP